LVVHVFTNENNFIHPNFNTAFRNTVYT